MFLNDFPKVLSVILLLPTFLLILLMEFLFLLFIFHFCLVFTFFLEDSLVLKSLCLIALAALVTCLFYNIIKSCFESCFLNCLREDS